MFHFLFIFIFLLCNVFCKDDFPGWSYINLHCRDNDNNPLDWWYIYKPPRGEEDSFLNTGRNFSYITSSTYGKWQESRKQISEITMLQYTLSPMYRKTYKEHFANVVYNNQGPDHKVASANGVIMADLTGGVWIGHTVPGIPDLEDDRVTFPIKEFETGHLLFCVSLDLPAVDMLGTLIRRLSPNIVYLHLPPLMKTRLPYWQEFYKPVDKNPNNAINFVTQNKLGPENGLRVSVLIRKPGEMRNLYNIFAKRQKIILDIYGHKQRIPTYCDKNYGVRKINKISLKLMEDVNYINSSIDKLGFAVSTAAHWQQRGSGKPQYWTCISSVEDFHNHQKSGLIYCVHNYNVWWSFDNFKVKEPNC